MQKFEQFIGQLDERLKFFKDLKDELEVGPMIMNKPDATPIAA